MGGVLPVVQDLGVPDQLARRGVESEDVVVVARIDDQLAMDRDIPVAFG